MGLPIIAESEMKFKTSPSLFTARLQRRAGRARHRPGLRRRVEAGLRRVLADQVLALQAARRRRRHPGSHLLGHCLQVRHHNVILILSIRDR